jgi:hypothetical protein
MDYTTLAAIKRMRGLWSGSESIDSVGIEKSDFGRVFSYT